VSTNTNSRRVTTRGLNRALLARQWLLERVKRPAAEVIEHLVGLQAQATTPPYVALWARVKDFRVAELSTLLTSRRAVRLAFLRSTIHLVTARDCLALRPALQPALDRGLAGSQYWRRLAHLDLDALVAAGRALADAAPLAVNDLGERLLPEHRGTDAEALGYALRTKLALVQVPPRGVWGEGGAALCTTAEAWLGKPLARATAADALVRRYLAAFGPATAADLQVWSGLPACKELMERLRPALRVVVDEDGRELFDVPRAPLPDADTPAPPRFLPEYDNAFIAHAARARIVAAADLARMRAGNGFLSPFLVDGFVRGTWKIARARGAATLTLHPTKPLTSPDRAALEDEGQRLLAFMAADVDVASRELRVARA
jgi:Winged helix DNA-binding domain